MFACLARRQHQVRERRERERERQGERHADRQSKSVCVCVCVCVWLHPAPQSRFARNRRQTWSDRQKRLHQGEHQGEHPSPRSSSLHCVNSAQLCQLVPAAGWVNHTGTRRHVQSSRQRVRSRETKGAAWSAGSGPDVPFQKDLDTVHNPLRTQGRVQFVANHCRAFLFINPDILKTAGQLSKKFLESLTRWEHQNPAVPFIPGGGVRGPPAWRGSNPLKIQGKTCPPPSFKLKTFLTTTQLVPTTYT